MDKTNEHKAHCKKAIREKLETQIADYGIRARAWRNARIKTRADGTEFAKLTNAFCENCTLTHGGFSYPDKERPKIEIRFTTAENRYTTDDLPAYGSLNTEYPHVTERGETVDNTPNTSHEINDRIEWQARKYDRYKADLQAQLDNLDKAFDPFYDAVMDGYVKLLGVCGGDDAKSLFYACVDHVIKDTYGMQRVAKQIQGGTGA